MKIFLIARGYPTKQDPTWGCFEKDQAEALAKLGHQVTILSVDTRLRFYWREWGVRHQVHGKIATVNIFLFPIALVFFLPERIKEIIRAWQMDLIYQQAEQHYGKPDVIYSHYLHNTLKAIPLKKKYNIPLVAIEHWSQLAHTHIPKTTIQLAKRVYSSVDQLLSVSSALQDNIRRQIGYDSLVVPNMVSQEFYYTTSTPKNNLTLVTVGRLVSEKHFDQLIKAVAHISEPLQLKIIGDGKEKENLYKLINELQLQEKVFLCGYKTKEEIVVLLQQSDIFVLPSQSETFGVVYIEALACGLPIIATDCGGPRDIVTPMNGLLVPINNQQRLEKAITHMIHNLHLYDKKLIAQDCQNRFSSENVAKHILKILENTIQKQKEQQ